MYFLRSKCRNYVKENVRLISGVIHVAEDTAILDASIDTVTSRTVREKIKANESVSHLVGEKINEYIAINRIGPKVSKY